MLLIEVCHMCSLSFLVLFGSLFDFVFLRIIRTTGRSEGKNLSNNRLEIKYIILGIDHCPLPLNGCMFEKINECTSNMLKHLEKTVFKGIKLLKKQNTGNKTAYKKVLT